ncbi:MAG: tripartite tricarboxylate transporter substrate binding protein [Burkholderiales bacterium]|nr:tripartite tricarboxylate transporter substrate binding protein [Burkholderiales bacterium]
MRNLIGGLIVLLASCFVHAEDWPARPIRFVVPWTPGGLADIAARAFNDQVSRTLGQPVVTDYKPGAGGMVGTAEIARATPDGYTIGMGNLAPLTILPSLFKDMQYNVEKDLVAVTMFAASPLVLASSNAFPAKTVAEVVAAARANPGKLNYASVGVGTAQHLIFEIFRRKDGIEMQHIPYKGTSTSLPALISDQVQLTFETLPSLLPQIRAGKVRAIAVTTPQRVPQLPDVPTLTEVGYPEIDVVTWYAVIVPAGTPRAIIERLYKEYTAAAQTPEIQKFLSEQGLVYLQNAPGQFAQRIRAESARWAQIIREQNIRVTRQ